MRKSTKLIVVAAAAAAGIAVMGASSAFTDSNTVPDSTAGYGTSTVSGVQVDAVNYTQNATNPKVLDAVNFTTAVDVTAMTSTLTLTVNGIDLVFACQTPTGSGPYVIPCDVSGGTADIATLTNTALTVTS